MLKYSNFAKTTMDEDLTDVETALDVVSASNFPTSGNFMLVFWEAEYSSPLISPAREIVKCTGVSSDTFTITRGQESTTGVAWSTGDNVALVLTAGMMDEILLEMGTAVNNTLYNTTFNVRTATTALPVGWSKSGAGTATYSFDTYGLIVAAAGGDVLLYQQGNQANFLAYTHSYWAMSAYAYKGAAGHTASLQLIDPGTSAVITSVAITATAAYALYRINGYYGGSAPPIFGLAVTDGSTARLKLPTIVQSQNLVYPSLSHSDHISLGGDSATDPKRGQTLVFGQAITAGNTASFDMTVVGYNAYNTQATVYMSVDFMNVATTKYGTLEAVVRNPAGTVVGGPIRVVSNDSNAYVSTTVAASKVSLTLTAPNLIVTNNLADDIRVCVSVRRG